MKLYPLYLLTHLWVGGIDIAMEIKTMSKPSLSEGKWGNPALLYLQREESTHVVLERRDATEETCDLFKYTGMLRDSDIFSFGFAFAPWKKSLTISPREDTIEHLNETVENNRFTRNINLGCNIVPLANWSQNDMWEFT